MGTTTSPSRGEKQRHASDLLIALAAIDLWVGDLARVRSLLMSGFGFRSDPALGDEDPGARDEDVAQLVNGGVRVVLRQGIGRSAAVTQHVETHGDTVADVMLYCADPVEIGRRAFLRGLRVTGPPDRPTVDLTGDGCIRHTVTSTPSWPAAPAADVHHPGTVPERVDHIALCLPWGLADPLAETYETVFGMGRMDADSFEDIGGRETGMRSIVLRSPGGFTAVLTEPVAPGAAGQTQRFVDAHGGPGVQHVALLYPDLIRAVARLRSAGLEFLRVPGTYYEQARDRLGDRLNGQPVPWADLTRLEILADADDQGLLFQLFTPPIADRGTFFVELIQRSGATGFGANNVRALFAAVDAAYDGERE